MTREVSVAAVPDSLQQLLLAQFANLPSEQRQVLEIASVVGRTFTVASVTAGLQMNLNAVEAACEELARGQFIEDRGLVTWPDGTVSGHYGFCHVLYQEVLYQGLGTGRRVRIHRAIGAREEAGYGEYAMGRAAELARHFAEGQDVARALHYLVQAGKKAFVRAAYPEALHTFTQGLTLLTVQPVNVDGRQHELELQVGLGMTLMAMKGFAAPEAEQAFQRAHTLCHQLGETPELLPVLTGLWSFSSTRGELRTARQLAERMLRFTHDAADPALLGVAWANMQATLYFQGELTAARTYGEQVLSLSDIAPLPPQDFYYVDLTVRTQSNAASVLLTLGYSDQALRQMRAAHARAHELEHLQTIALTRQFLAGIHGGRREWREMQTHATDLITFAVTHNLPFWWAQGTTNYGIAVAQQGHFEEGLGHIQQGLAVYRMTGATLGMTRILGWLAESYGQIGQLEQGLATLDEALLLAERNDERLWEAELYRRKGELLLQSHVAHRKSHVEEVEACFLKAIDIARRQQAKAWELRAVMSLVRLRKQQLTHNESRRSLDEAQKMLTEIYDWFTEGFDAQDLQEAKVLIEELRE